VDDMLSGADSVADAIILLILDHAGGSHVSFCENWVGREDK
jgi:hypothetical protein